MTTLPTTSSIRLPRAGGPGGPVVNMPSTAIGPVGIPQQQPLLTSADIWRVIRGNLWLIIAAVVIGSLLGGGLFWWQLKTNPRFEAEGLLVLNRLYRDTPEKGPTALDNDYELEIEQKTHAQMLLQPDLWDRVIETNTRLRESEWFQQFVKATEPGGSHAGQSAAVLARNDLEDNFRVTPVLETKLLRVTFEAGTADDSRNILRYVVDAHIGTQENQTTDRTAEDLERAKVWREQYARYIRDRQAKINELQARLNGSGAMVGARTSMKEIELSNIIGALTTARIEASEAQGQYDSVKEMVDQGTDPPQVEMAIRQDLAVTRLRQTVDDLELQLESLAQRYGAKSEFYADRLATRDAARKRLADAEAEARATARNQILDALKSELQAKKTEEQMLSARVDTLREELGELSTKMAEYLSYKDEIDSYKVLHRAMDDKVNVLQSDLASRKAPVAWQAVPVTPEERSSPKWQIYIPLGIFAGLALSLGYAFLREITDTRVRSPRDIAKVGPMNLLGMISDESDDPQLAGVPLHLVISQAPHSIMAEQFRQVRTRLQHAASLDTTRTIVVSSASPQDGKSVVACNLAAGLALNGRRILLVDANFRRPELHKLFGVANEVGFANVLDSVANLESAIHKTNIPNLELLATGPRPGNPTELLESQLFSDFIDRALEEYDHVIFDTGPLLVVSEAVALAPRVDGVITVVRAKSSSRGMLSRVRETLRQIKAENLGVVLNGVQKWGGGYYGRNIKTYYAYQNEV